MNSNSLALPPCCLCSRPFSSLLPELRPLVLPCGHSICQQCADDPQHATVYAELNKDSNSLEHAEVHQNCPGQARQDRFLPTNFALLQMLQAMENHTTAPKSDTLYSPPSSSSSLSFTIRRAFPSDGARCAAIYSPFVLESSVSFEFRPPDALEMEKRITDINATHDWLVAEIPSETGRLVIGYAYGGPHRARWAYRLSADMAVYIDPAYARLGIGRALYSALFPLLKARGIHSLYAGISLPNPGSLQFHRSQGFSLVGIYRQVGHKFDQLINTCWYQKPLKDTD